MAKNSNDDFDPREAIAKLSANLEQPDKFAKLFCEAAEQQKSIDAVLKKNIKQLIQSDNDIADSIKSFQREVDKEDWRRFIKKFGGFIYSIGLLIIGAVLQALSKKFL